MFTERYLICLWLLGDVKDSAVILDSKRSKSCIDTGRLHTTRLRDVFIKDMNMKELSADDLIKENSSHYNTTLPGRRPTVCTVGVCPSVPVSWL
ncbi:unnamed protein product [Danaus chrysippus]|uniref:(African queen) hypothetical protein n=1 Tax=Danaus chrysippus TaxID=151541 RepID=A0A8J2QTP4_9NEOP|nr:unnamed protein product [Danaus chrysippus]